LFPTNKVKDMINQVGGGLREIEHCDISGDVLIPLWGIAFVTHARDVNSTTDQGGGDNGRRIIVDGTPLRGWCVPLGRR
jgi:hypothetical protein